MVGYSSFFGSCDFTYNINVELYVIPHRLDLASTQGYGEIICEHDSLSPLNFIKVGILHTWPHGAIVDYISVSAAISACHTSNRK